MSLDRIQVAGFKSIRELDLELRPLNVLVGANGAGKSNLVGLFALLGELVRGHLQVAVQRAGGASSLLHHGPKRTRAIEVSAWFGQSGYKCSLEHQPGDRLFFANEVTRFDDEARPDERYKERLGKGHVESWLRERAMAGPGVAWQVHREMSAWRVHHFHDTSAAAAVKQLGAVDDNARLRSDAANLAAFLHALRAQQRPCYERILAAVRQVAPFFEDFQLRPSPLRPDQIQLEWSERGSDAYFNAHALSDGTLRYICLATLLLQPELPSLVIIDEPELGLHPYAIHQLAALLRQASSRGCTLLVATQSVTLLNQLEPEDVVVVDRRDGQSTFERISAEQFERWADDYAVGDQWEKNVFGGRPRSP